jgi:hypothetical protein
MRRSAIWYATVTLCAIVRSASAQGGEILWDSGPNTGGFRTCLSNNSWNNYADDVLFDQFAELTGIDIWTCIPSPSGDMQIKILFTDPFLPPPPRPGNAFMRWDMTHTGYVFDGNFNGTDLYKVSFDFDPILLRADTRYWFGVTGNGWDLGQGVLEHETAWFAYFQARRFIGTLPGVQMFRLRGQWVHPPFEMALTGECPGEMTASVIGATPDGRVAFLYGQRGGETTIPDGPCRGVRLPVGNAHLVRIVTADSEGNAEISGNVPGGCGTVAVVAVDLTTCEVTEPARTYARPELYLGPRIANTHGFADFNQCQVRPSCVEEGGMLFRRANDNCSEYFGCLNYCGGDGTPALYMGGARDMLSITRLDGKPFDAIEFNAGDGLVNNCFNYLWIRAVLDGVVVADFGIDMPRWQTVGLVGGEFDEIRVGAYTNAPTRDFVMQNGNERSIQTLAIDNVRFGTLTPAPTLTLTGSCPGPMTADIANATPNGTVALIFGRREGQTPIPTGPCAGTILPIADQIQLAATTRADPNGEASLTLPVPSPACGGRLIALDAPTCAVSRAVVIE